MDIGTSFSYVFQDAQWLKKVAIGGGILLVGVLFSWLLALPLLAAAILLAGYTLTVTKNVAEGSALPLPEWNDFGAFFMKGLYAAIGAIVLYIPVILLVCCQVIINAVMTQMVSGSSRGSSDGTLTALGFLLTCIGCLQFIVGVVTGFFIYAPMTRFALSGQLSTFWDFRGNWAFIQGNFGNYLIAWLLTIVAGFLGALGLILCIIPVFFTGFWASLVSSHLFGQYARGSASAQMMTPPTMSPSPTM